MTPSSSPSSPDGRGPRAGGEARPLSPAVRVVWLVEGLAWSVVTAVVSALVDYRWLAPDDGAARALPAGLVFATATILALVLTSVLPRRRYDAWRWDLDEVALHAESGWLRRVRRSVPLASIRRVELVRAAIAGKLGLAEIRVSADEAGRTVDVRIPGLRADLARALEARLLAGPSSADEGEAAPDPAPDEASAVEEEPHSTPERRSRGGRRRRRSSELPDEHQLELRFPDPRPSVGRAGPTSAERAA